MSSAAPVRLHFATQLYRPARDGDFQRLLEGLERNLQLPFVALATIFLDGCEPPWSRPEVRFVPLARRADYADFLALLAASPEEPGSPCTHLLFANSDIVFDASIEEAAEALAQRKLNNAICLTRREQDGSFPAGIEPLQSQDAWMLRQQPLPPLLLDQLRGIRLGVAGCEHLLAAALLAHGFNLWNPCEDCTAWHSDPEPLGYAPDAERYWGLYVYVPPCRIAEMGAKDLGVYFSFSRAPGKYIPVTLG